MKGKLSKLRNEKKTNKLIQASKSLNKELKNQLKNPILTLNNEKNQIKINNQIKDSNNSNLQNLYAEDTDYEIESISKHISDSQRNNYPNMNLKQSYIEQLELKIQDQARRLNELYKYKLLCEKRIRELNPNEIIPLTEESIKSNSKKSSIKDESENNKYDELYEKYKKLKKNFKDFKENSAQSERSNDSNINIEKYKLLKEKYKKLKNENEEITDLLNQETKATEEQKNIISLLQQTIDSELFKNGTINQYISPENIIDFVKLKNEADEYRKELVLSQAMVNSLKYEIEQLNKEKKENNESRKNSIESNNIENDSNINNHRLNSNIDDYYYKKNFKGRSNSQNKFNIDNIRKNINSIDFSDNKSNDDNYNNDNYFERNNKKNYLNENLNLKTNINKQNQTISGLLKEKSELKKLISELMYKINESLSLNNDAKDKIKSLELEIALKKNELSQFEDKFTYFNDYISNLKISLSDLQNYLKNYITILNKMANEDLNSLLTKSFSDNILILKNKISNIPSIQKYNLEYDKDSKLIKLVIDTLTIVNSEFVNIYEKVFESNGYCKESTQKLEQLQNEINNRNLNLENQKKDINFINNQLNEQIQENIIVKSNNDNLIKDNSFLIFENSQLKRDIDFLNHFNNKNIDLMNIICKISQITDSKLSKIIKEIININQIISKLKEERNDAYQQLNKKNNNNQSINIEKNTLNQLLNEFDRKINEKEIKLDELKRELNILFNMYNSYGNNDLKNTNYIPLDFNTNNNKHLVTNSLDYSIKKTHADSNLYSNTEFNTHQNTMSNQFSNYDNNLNYKYGNKEDFQKFIETNNSNSSLINSYIKNPEFSNNDRKKITYQVLNTSPH